MKATTESALLKFMAKVSKAIDSEGEITPEDITPEMLSDADFQQRIRLYGHTVEEVEQLIADGKCIEISHSNMDAAHYLDEDFTYVFDDSPFKFNGKEFTHIDLNIDYILFNSNNTTKEQGLLLKKIPTTIGTYGDAFGTFYLEFDESGNYMSTTIGYSSL